MNALEKVSLNSVNLIDERLKLLQQELNDIEKEYGPLKCEKPEKKPQSFQRYQDLPSTEPEPVTTVAVKPQIKDDYLRTLQYVPDIMSEYSSLVQEPQFINDANELVVPPRSFIDNSLLYSFLEAKTKEYN